MRGLYPALLLAGLILAGVPAGARDKIRVVASFSILGDMVRQVTGDLAEVTTIVGPDADAHVYTPNAADAKAVADAEVIFVNGLGFETWSQTLIETSGTKAEVSVATDGITPLRVDGEVDPHAWNSLTNGMKYVASIAESMAGIDPESAPAYKANARAYTARLKELHARALRQLKRLPPDQRTVVTAHDAFGYLEAAYGLTFLAPVGIDTEAEPSARDVARLIDHLKQVGAGALFVENITSPSLIQQIARETGIRIGGRLFSDALSERGGPATSYERMFEHNLETLIRALSQQSQLAPGGTGESLIQRPGKARP
ncbi:MAG: zinc ABC transporter substrate-binding protein [Gemmatimonadaceae bacterium]|nr:zinc ABC transporter substrate-binding protein [Gemmatimonadaceae bacterium]